MRSKKLIAIPLLLGALITVALACTATPASPSHFEPRDVTTSPAPDATATPRPSSGDAGTPGGPPPTGETDPTSTSVPKPTQTPTTPPVPPPTGGSDAMVPTPAPIDGVEVEIAKSFPPQYFLTVHSGLPNGCVRFGSYEVARESDIILIRVTNLQPADREIMCTQVYGNVETRISLGSDFEPGKKITVHVNDVTKTFTTQGALVGGESPDPIPAALDAPFELPFGRIARVAPERLEISFEDVAEDSRCPANLTCVWEGRAVILVNASGPDGELRRFELTLQGGRSQPARIGDLYVVEILALRSAPDGTASSPISRADYVADLVVSRIGSDASVPVVRLSVSLLGGQPLGIQAVAEIVGGHDNSQSLYCQGWSWDFGDGSVSADMPACLRWTPDSRIQRHFETTYAYDAPGTYDISFTYGPLSSETISVEVE